MISRYSEILHYTKLINDELVYPGHVQKIYSTSFYISFQVRVTGKSIYILIGRGSGHEGVFLASANPASEIRKKDKWLEWMRKHVSGALLSAIEIDSQDRAIALVLQKGGVRERVYIAWIGRESFFFHEIDGIVAFKSWSRQKGEESSFEIFDEVGRRVIGLSQEIRKVEGDTLLAEEFEKAGRDSQISKKNKKKFLKINKIKADIEKLSHWRELKEWIENVSVESLDKREMVESKSLKIKLDHKLTAYQKRDLIFNKIKAFREAEKSQILRLNIEESSKVEPAVINQLKTIAPVWSDIEKNIPKIQTEDQYRIHLADGFQVGIGLTAEGNDKLRKFWAKPDDVWVHAANEKSAHAVIKLKEGVSFSIEMLRVAVSFILKQSGKEKGWLEVVYTQVKNLKSVSGTVGMVTFKKEKRITLEASE